MTSVSFAILAGLLMITSAAGATTVSLTGHLSDPSDPRIIGPDPSGAGAIFTADPLDSTNNVVIYSFQVTTPSPVQFQTQSFALGGIDPYFSLFTGTGDSAAFLDSNFSQAFSTGGDIDLTISLGVGMYTAALSAFANMSFAENLGAGTLGDGFIGLGFAAGTGDPTYYNLEISGDGLPASVPEPGTLGLVVLCVTALIGVRGRFTTQKAD
jgi:hypothetical protein